MQDGVRRAYKPEREGECRPQLRKAVQSDVGAKARNGEDHEEPMNKAGPLRAIVVQAANGEPEAEAEDERRAAQ